MKRVESFVGILFVVMVGLLGLTQPAHVLDLKGLDLMTHGHFADPDIAILAIDDPSIAAIGRWPWDRTVEATILEKLAAFSPRAVGIDINFSDPENAASDNALAKSITSAPYPIVLPVEPISFSDGTSGVISPLPLFTSPSNVQLGNVEVPQAADGDARHFPDGTTVSGASVPPFATAIASAIHARPLGTNNSYAINFAGSEGTFATYSISRVLDGSIDSQALQNKIILIGATANDLHDFVNAPVRGGIISGIEWHANVLDNILLDRPFTNANGWATDIAGIVIAGLYAWFALRAKPRAALLVAAGVLIVIPLASFLFLQENILIPYASNELLFGATFVAYGLYTWYRAEAEKRRVRKIIQNYFSPAVLETIMKNPKSLSLGGERRTVSILFSDIRSFTTISETTPPEKLTALLHEYFTEMTESVLATDGVLDKFIGDAIMAFWGAPLDQPDHADQAVEAAMRMLERLSTLQKKWTDAGLPFIDIGIGIHTGPAIVGNMGSEKRFDYTVIGDTVNTASRLEGLNKEHKTHLIISEATKNALKKKIAWRPIGNVVVRGKTAPVSIYTVT